MISLSILQMELLSSYSQFLGHLVHQHLNEPLVFGCHHKIIGPRDVVRKLLPYKDNCKYTFLKVWYFSIDSYQDWFSIFFSFYFSLFFSLFPLLPFSFIQENYQFDFELITLNANLNLNFSILLIYSYVFLWNSMKFFLSIATENCWRGALSLLVILRDTESDLTCTILDKMTLFCIPF